MQGHPAWNPLDRGREDRQTPGFRLEADRVVGEFPLVKPRTLKDRLASGELCPVFALSRIVHPVVVEMFGRAGGYRGFWLDQEHASNTTEQIAVLALAARANDMDMIVRLPPTGYWQVTQCLEAGAGGVMAAQIHSVDQAREFVSWTRFTPAGTRGLNNNGCDADYTHVPHARFIAEANQRVLAGIQIETTGALEQVEPIAALPGVDLLFVGPSDLSMSLGIVGQFHHAVLWEAIERIANACRSAGTAWGCVAPDAAFAERAIELGCRMPTLGNEILALRRGVDSLRSTFEKAFLASV
ncbi:MAG: host specificity protein [Planctomycetes bacterium]|nr:host specificity protein [Planctomycetota bacterium]